MKESTINMTIEMLNEILADSEGRQTIQIDYNDGNAFIESFEDDERETIAEAVHVLINMLRS